MNGVDDNLMTMKRNYDDDDDDDDNDDGTSAV